MVTGSVAAAWMPCVGSHLVPNGKAIELRGVPMRGHAVPPARTPFALVVLLGASGCDRSTVEPRPVAADELAIEAAPAGAPPAPPPTSSGSTCPIANTSWPVHDFTTPSEYVFRLAIGPSLPPSDEAVGPPGELAICRRGSSVLLQRIIFPSLGWREHYIPELYVDDFNFDGLPDFALHDGDSGPYGAATFGIYLQAPSRDTFSRSEALSEFAELAIAPMVVDAATKQLRLASKSGCCIHWFEWYAVSNGKPRLVKRETTRDLSPNEPGCTVTTKTFDRRGGSQQSVRACDPAEELASSE